MNNYSLRNDLILTWQQRYYQDMVNEADRILSIRRIRQPDLSQQHQMDAYKLSEADIPLQDGWLYMETSTL